MTISLLDTNHCSRLIENDPDVLCATQDTHPITDPRSGTQTRLSELVDAAIFSTNRRT